MSSAVQQPLSDIQKLKEFTSSKIPRKTQLVSKFWTPNYTEKSKLDDVTRFNSSHFCVTFYQDYPKRDGTPMKINPEKQQKQYRRSLSPKVSYVKSLLRKSSVGGGEEINKELFNRALEANLRTMERPKMLKHRAGISHYVLNDFHIRETNPGFARNELGRIYNH